MKTITTIAALSALALTYQVSASPLSMNIMTNDNTARIVVTENGQPVVGVPVTVKGLTTQTEKTANDGSVLVTNFNDNASTYTFTLQQDNGSVLTEKRLLSREH